MRAFNEDSNSKLKKGSAGSNDGPQTGEFWDPWGQRNKEGQMSRHAGLPFDKQRVGGFPACEG